MMWINPWSDAAGGGFQIIQSFIAIGSGGITGRGFMQGLQKIGFLPESNTDFIYAVIGEEFGLIGTTLVLLAFVVIAWRGYRVATTMPDTYGSFLALGLTTLLAAQALANISVVIGVLPNKGLPLPFVSAGGSSMFVSMLAVGMLLNLSQHTAPRLVGGMRAAEAERDERHQPARRDCRGRHRGTPVPGPRHRPRDPRAPARRRRHASPAPRAASRRAPCRPPASRSTPSAASG